jgi:hypothetical protein
LNRFAPDLIVVVNPDEFEHDILKEKAPIGRSLARMRGGGAFSKTKLNKGLSLRSTNIGTNEAVI